MPEQSINPSVLAMWRESWQPPDRRPAWQWAEEHVKSIPYSPNPGAFRSDNSPWIRAPLEALTDITVKKVQIVAAIQAGKTLLSEIGSAYIIPNMPGPMLWLDQQDDEAKDELEGRLMPLWKCTAPVRRLISGARGRNRYKTKRNKVTFINGMPTWVLGAHNKKNLQRRSIRWLIGDETWQWPPGHMAEAEARVTAFGWLGKIFFSSQAGEVDDDTDLSFRGGTQEEWNFVCLNPECETLQPYLLENLDFSEASKRDDGSRNMDEVVNLARIVCPHCGHRHNTNEIRTRRMMNDPERGAKFVVMNPDAPANYRSFHWNGFASTPCGEIAKLYVEAKAAERRGDVGLLKIFYQKRLATPWLDMYSDYKMEIERSTYLMGEDWDEECGILRNGVIVDRLPDKPERADFPTEEDYLEALQKHSRLVGSKPVRGRMLKVDCQRDHYWATVSSFSANGSMRLLWCAGGREAAENPNPLLTWEDVEALQERFDVANHLVFVDAGDNTNQVYQECAKRGWTALMGDGRHTFTHRIPIDPKFPEKGMKRVERFYSPEKRIMLGRGLFCRMHFFSNLQCKDILARMRNNQDATTGATYEVPDDVPEYFLRHMDSERRIKKGAKWAWELIGKRPNHLWDCEAMGISGMVMMKLLGRDAVEEKIEEPEKDVD